MKQDYPKLTPIWLLIFLAIFWLLLMTSCRGGRSISSKSTGITVISPADLERQANGTYRIKPKKIEVPPAKPLIPAPVEIKSTPIPPVSAVKPTTLIPAPPKNEPLPLATPSVTLIPAPPEIVNIIPLPEEEISPEEPVVENPSTVKIHWAKLFLFYSTCMVVGVLCWLGYKKLKNRKIKSEKRVRRPRKKKS